MAELTALLELGRIFVPFATAALEDGGINSGPDLFVRFRDVHVNIDVDIEIMGGACSEG